MRLLVVRHGHAVEEAEAEGLGDAGRWLSGKGRRRSRQAFARLVAEEGGPEEIWTSPLVRAVQTAEILAAAAELEGGVRVVPELAPGLEVGLRARLLAREAEGGGLALVGHEPGLGQLASALLGRPAWPFKKSGILGLELGHGGARFLFQRQPKRPRIFRELPES